METQYISLNMTPTGVNPCFHISQYDVGRMLGFIVHSGGATVDLDTYTCTIEATRSDGTAITSAVATTDNIGTFEVTPTMSNKADKYRCQLIIVDANSKRVASLPFDMEVTKAAMDENSEAIEEDASLYQQYTKAVQGAIAEANADIQAEENARIAAVSAEATARADAITAEATARQTADNTLQGNINSEASTRASADSNLQSQINQIVAPSGEAPSAAEVQNARIGADGVTYDTLGNAIRGQVGNLKSAIDQNTKVVDQVRITIDSAIIEGKNIDQDGRLEDNSSYNLYAFLVENLTKINVSGGDLYGYYTGFPSNSTRYDKTRHIKSVNEITIPSEVKYVAVRVRATENTPVGQSIGYLTNALESNEAVCMFCKNGISFDTTAKTVTISKPIYLFIGKNRYDFESDNVVLNYNVSGPNAKMLILRNGAFTIIPYTQFDITTDTAIWTFSANDIANTNTNNIWQPYSVDGEWIRPQMNFTKSTGIIQSANTLLNVPNGIWFDTVNGQIVFKKAFYVTIGTVRHDYESNDVIVSYSGISGNTVMLVYDKTEGLKCISLNNWNVYSQTPIFTFQKNGLTNIKTNNIFYPYYVDGMLFNEERECVLVDGATGDDTNPGTYTLPFKTIQKGIDSNARYIFVARGTYNENINITSKRNMQIIPYSTPIFSTSAFDVLMIIVNSVNISSSYDVLLRDIHANNPASDSGSWVINNSYNIVFDHCWASNGEGGGFVATNLYGRFIQCKAWDIGDSSHYNSDGFNFHGYGATELIDCIAHDCYDDGISHHDGCVATIKGGEFWNCTHGGGIAPVNRYTEIDGAYCHDNAWGLQATQADVTLYDPYILVKNSVLKNNAQKDISIGEIPCKVLRCTFDTKDIPEGAQYVEIN